jgi:hypothetical protein
MDFRQRSLPLRLAPGGRLWRFDFGRRFRLIHKIVSQISSVLAGFTSPPFLAYTKTCSVGYSINFNPSTKM